MSSGRHYFALTNTHGWRLAIQASRVGIAPYSAAPALDASSLVGGFPLIAKGQPPRGLEGAEGSVIALELVAAQIPRRALRDVQGAPGAMLLLLPLPLTAVRRVHFQTASEQGEFLAGLSVLEESLPWVPASVPSPSLFAESWRGLEAPRSEVPELGRKWQMNLDRQARVSAAMLIGAAVAGADDWVDECLAALRSHKSDRDCGDERGLATALARINAIEGWSNDDLLAALEHVPGGEGHTLLEFARAWVEARDPFGGGGSSEATSDSQAALELLLGAQGLSPRQFSDQVVGQAREVGAVRASALAGLSIGRHLLPRSLRPQARDLSLAGEEIAAAARALRPLAIPRAARRAVSGIYRQAGFFDT